MAVVSATRPVERLVSVLRIREFRLLWLVSAAWYAARWVDTVTTGWLALTLTDSPVFLALVGACRMLPLLVLGIAGGVLAARVHPRTVLLGAVLAGAAISGWLVVAAALGTLHPWQLVLTTLGTNTLWELSFPSQRSLVAETTAGRASLTNALALDNFVFVGSNVLFSALAGELIPRTGPQGAYLLAAGAFLSAVPLLLALRRPTSAATPAITRGMEPGYRAVLSRPVVAGVIVISLVMNGLSLPVIQLLPLVAREVLQVGPVELGRLTSAWGGGSLLGNALIFLLAPRRGGLVFFLGSLGAAIGFCAFSLVHSYPLALLLILLAGVLMSYFGTFQSALLIEAAGVEGRAKALGALTVAIGIQPLGVLAIGWLASLTGPSVAFTAATLAGTVAIAGSAACFPDLLRYRTRLVSER
ncbi:MAG: MFS transporter [Chloroflexi bacterium]|nr:MFS transporter [Chloroflexota bacterium]